MGTPFLIIFSNKFDEKSAFFFKKLKTQDISIKKTQEICSKTQGICSKTQRSGTLGPSRVPIWRPKKKPALYIFALSDARLPDLQV